jgi:hypothetical protein
VQKILGIFTAAAAATAIALLSACSSGSQGGGSTPSGASQGLALSDLSRSGISPKFLGLARLFQEHGVRVLPDKRAKKQKDLFVSDLTLNAVELLKNTSWTNTGSITSDIDGPDGSWVDAKGNLYVSNYKSVDIEEYAPRATSPKHTYSSNMLDPVNVTTDSKGNVYEADFEGKDVGEYAQGSNTQSETCGPGGWVTGVAVDKSGNVFVAYLNSNTDVGHIAEYQGGLSGCSETTLGLTIEFPGGMVLDKNGDLVVVDQNAAAIDVIAPPYGSVTGTLGSGYNDPFNVTINKKNNQAYVANYGDADVLVLSYPRGTTEATLGASNGLQAPASAVDGLNYNP